jgi:hypothetical protein
LNIGRSLEATNVAGTYLFCLRLVFVFFRGAILSRIAAHIVRACLVFLNIPGNESGPIEIVQLVPTPYFDELARFDVRVSDGSNSFLINIV